MAGSAFPTLKQRLTVLLAARPEFADVQHLSTSEPEKTGDVVQRDGTGDAIWFRDTVSELDPDDEVCIPQIWVEEFTTDLVVQVVRGRQGFTQDDCDDRVSELLGGLLAVVGADPELGLSGSLPSGILQAHMAVDGFTVEPAHTSNMVGFLAASSAQISGFARLQPT